MDKKKYLVYSLISKLNTKEKIKFRHFIFYYFKTPETYIDLYEKINQLLKPNHSDFFVLERQLIKKLKNNNSFSKNKFNLKKCIFSFLRTSYLDQNEKTTDSSTLLSDFIDTKVLYNYKEEKHAYELLEKLSLTLEENNKFELLNNVLVDLLENYVPQFGYNPPMDAYQTLMDQFNKNLINLEETINSRYLKRVLFLLRINYSKENLDLTLKKVARINNTHNLFEVEHNILNSYAQYYSITNELNKEIETRLKIVALTEEKGYQNEQKKTKAILSIHVLIILYENSINQGEFDRLRSKVQTLHDSLSNIKLKEAFEIMLVILDLFYLILFEKNAMKMKEYLQTVKAFAVFPQEAKTSVVVYYDNLISCLFLANEIERCHTICKNDFPRELNITTKFLFCYLLSSFLNFNIVFLQTEYRNLKRLINDSPKEHFGELLKLLYSLKKEGDTYSESVLKKHKQKIVQFMNAHPEQFQRVEKILLEHFFKQLKRK